MTSLVRRTLLPVRQVKKCRKLSVLIQADRPKSVLAKIPEPNNSRRQNTLRVCQFHTSSVDHKIVAFKLSDIGEGIREVVIKEWFVKVGDKVAQFDNICEVQSDKASVTITSRYDGVVTKLYHEVDKTALVGQPLVDFDVEDESGEDSATGGDDSAETIATQETQTEQNVNRKVKVLTTPAVRRIASQFKVDLSTVAATGKNGRVLKEDILSFLDISSDKSNVLPDDTFVQATTMGLTQATARTEVLMEDRVVPITGFTKAMVKSMTESMKIPHFGFSDEYDISKLVQAREDLKPTAQQRGVKLTYMPLIIKATSLSLTSFPVLNSSLDNNCENLIYKSNHNIGVAMDTPNGLVVPVIKNVEKKTVMDIACELNALQEKGSKGQLGLAELTGGTFTLSNIGIVGGTYTKPVILAPQVSIAALGKIQVSIFSTVVESTIINGTFHTGQHTLQEPSLSPIVWLLPRFDSAGDLMKAYILTVSFSADHRVVDGVTMAKFSEALKAYLENPNKLLLDL